MDGVSLSTTRPLESFGSSKAAAGTLSRLANLISQAESKPLARNQRQEVPHLSTYICSECGKFFSYASELLHHQEVEHTLPKPHRCPTCGQEFSLKSTLQLHKCDSDILLCELCGVKSQFGTSCPVCTAQTSDLGNSSEKSPHFQSQFLDSCPYTCAPCGKGFSQKQALLQHQQAGCSELPSSSGGSSTPSAPPCLDGDFDTFDSTDASLNVQMSETSSKVECSLQLWRVCLPETSHAEEQQSATQRKRTKRECTVEATTSMNRQEHRRLGTKNKLLKCRSCNMVFRNTSKLYLHRQEKHIREKPQKSLSEPKLVTTKHRKKCPYPCQICGKVFFHHLSLRAHLRQHTKASFDKVKCSASKANPGVADSKKVRAGRGRPRKVHKLDEKVRKEEEDEKMEEQPGVGKEEDVREHNKEKEVEELWVEEPEDEEEEEESEFPCPSCAEIFSQQWQLLEHTELHQSSMKQRQCSVCTNQIEAHKWPRSKRHRLYHCVPCQKGFSAMDCFLEHCQQHLRARVEEDSVA
ncbi:zinc finger protein 135 isoform X1 [Cynoglossus semilaevis]|uniref:Si:ch211-148l7.4 n=1 Tax=Cynoglossus semilaevis TaxID=244447 RepID=A0A3P8UTY9_CYNSE|nr:zinc finger protein 135-like isoform X1 [Cynoglossus semilaevis]